MREWDIVVPPDVQLLLARPPTTDAEVAEIERCLDATLAQLDVAGLEGFDVERVAADAGLSVETVRGWFPDDGAMWIAMVLRAYAEAQREFRVVVANLRTVDDVRAAVVADFTAFFELHRVHPGLTAASVRLRHDPTYQHLSDADARTAALRLAEIVGPFVPANDLQPLKSRCLLLTHLATDAVMLAERMGPAEAATTLAEYVRIAERVLP